MADRSRKPRLTKNLVAKGWIPGVFDICWLGCENPGHAHLVVEGRTIVLCVEHIKELEETASKGYNLANPPEGYDEGVWWPWIEYYEEFGWGLPAAEDVIQ